SADSKRSWVGLPSRTYSKPAIRSPAGPCWYVVARWIGGAIAPVAASGSAPACTNRVSARIARLLECAARGFERSGDIRLAVRRGHEAGLESGGGKKNAALEH